MEQQQQQPTEQAQQQPPQGGQFPQGGRGMGRGRGRGRGGNGGGYGGGYGGGNAGVVSMPPGWQMAFSPQGEPYYIDHNTRTTHWTPPYHLMGGQQGGWNQGGGRGRGQGRVGIDHAKRKTKMCMNWESGSCPWGDQCAFAHGAHEISSPTGQPGGGEMPQQPPSPQQAPQ